MTTRRGFLHGILAAGMAPAIVKAEILMPVRKIIAPQDWWKAITIETQILPPVTMAQYISDQVAGSERYREMIDEAMFIGMSERMRLTRELIAHGVLKGNA